MEHGVSLIYHGFTCKNAVLFHRKLIVYQRDPKGIIPLDWMGVRDPIPMAQVLVDLWGHAESNVYPGACGYDS